MLTVTLLVALVAFVTAIGAGVGKVPVWVPVLLLSIALLLQLLPIR